jgi:pimeloyl-ACP methyl ester carboxylesterase
VAPTAAGVIALIAGTILLTGGIASLVRRARRWWRLPVVMVALGIVLPVVYSLTIAVAATNVPPTPLGVQTPADRGLVYRDVAFPSTDGVTLSGWYIPGANGAAVVLLHGAGSNRSSVLDHADVLARNGYGVLLFDARGHGRSAGRAMDFGWFGDDDVGGAVSFLAAQSGVDRIAAVGMSMGGEEAIGAAAADERIAAVVAEGATNRVSGDKTWLPDEYGIRGWLQRPVDWLTFAVADALTAGRAPMTLHAAALTTTSPILLIAAGDVADEAGAARYIASGSPDRVDLWVVPDTGHTKALSTHQAEWETRVTAFLAQALSRS